VDAAPIEAEGVEIVGVKLETFARLEEGTRHPRRGETKQAAGGGKFHLDQAFQVPGHRLELFDRGDAHGCSGLNSQRGPAASFMAGNPGRAAVDRGYGCKSIAHWQA